MDQAYLDVILVFATVIYALLSVKLPLLLVARGELSGFDARKLIHFFSGMAVLIIPFFSKVWLALVPSLGASVAMYCARPNSKLVLLRTIYFAISEEDEQQIGYLKGPFLYALTITLLVGFFAWQAPAYLAFPIAGIMLMIFSDPCAAFVGKRWGRVRIPVPWTDGRRTVLGSFAFFCSAVMVVTASLSFYSSIAIQGQEVLLGPDIITVSVVTAVVATITEVLTPSFYDDLTLPITSTFTALAMTMF